MSGIYESEAASRIIQIARSMRENPCSPRAASLPPPTSVPSRLGLTETDVRRYSVLSMIRHICGNAAGDWRRVPTFESEMSLEIERNLKRETTSMDSFYLPYEILTRADTVYPGSGGGYLVPTETMSFVDLLRNRTVCFRLGATDLSGLVGNVSIPKQTAAATAYWLGTETSQATETDQRFTQLSLAPKNVSAYTELSRQLLLQGASVERVVMNDLATVAALAVDLGALSGSGTSGQPVGLLTLAGATNPPVQLFGGTVSTMPWASFLAMEADLLTANIPNPPAWVAPPALAATLAARQQFTNSSVPIWDGCLLDGTINGNHATSSQQISSGTLILGDWSQMVIGTWGLLEIEVNPYANFPAGIIGLRAILTTDVGFRNPTGFVVATGVS